MIKDYYRWNPMYCLVMKIKYDYINKFNDDEIDFETWLLKLNNEEYNNKFECLQTNQNDNLLLIRYGLAEMQEGMWKDKNSIYRECRSVVIDIVNDDLVITPFRKFFNLNEVEENKLNSVIKEADNAKLFEITNKLDGSMQCARYYNSSIIMTGSMALNKNNSWRLKDGISMLNDNHKLMIKDNPNLTFIFEYISIKDAHVVLYNKNQEGLYLIGVRNSCTGYQYSYKEIKQISEIYKVEMTNIEAIQLDELLKLMKIYKSYEKEGWVLNIDGHMIKIKCDDYVHLHRLLDKFSSVNVIIENIAEERFDDMISKVPDNYKDRVLKVANKIIKYKTEIENKINYYYYIAPKSDKKEFMIWVNNNCTKETMGYVRCKYLNKSFNVLKNSAGGYKKLKDLNISESYSALFSNLEEE
ncbi:T4 RnlA family RNA ligase [Clostridium botulinum]|uniref:T4 RnlA family RNA ligase n=1 Tax=Clostridium botulinum TaxID=1491 RepID=UPI001C9B6388|nr:T4 RnlA family RNA ligase [Clostridium botulinum]MBY6838741.1 hypothetical protein [Clostridium botulinum]